MSHIRTISLLALAALAGGLIGATVTRQRLQSKALVEKLVLNDFSVAALLQERALLDKAEVDQVRERIEAHLAQRVAMAEFFSTRTGMPGRVALATLKRVASHRSDPDFIREDKALKTRLEEAAAARK